MTSARKFTLRAAESIGSVLLIAAGLFLLSIQKPNLLQGDPQEGVSERYRSLLFLRDHKDDNGPSPSPLVGEACGRETGDCVENSYCDGGTCTECGLEYGDCCYKGGTEASCQEGLECAFFIPFGGSYCLKCWQEEADTCNQDSLCCDEFKLCQGGNCVSCGQDTETCCYGMGPFTTPDRCANGFECRDDNDNDTCTACKSEGDECGGTTPCCGQDDNELVCADVDGTDKCVQCGGVGEPACDADSNACDDEEVHANNRVCESDPCGGPREKCCFDKEDYCKSSDLACAFGGSRECVECAGSGQDCDDNTPCCSGNEACDRTGKCTACGGELQPCCETESQGLIILMREAGDASSDLECNSGLTCDNEFGVCVSCGGFSELCCSAHLPENQCKESTETCNDSGMGASFKCETCAAKDESCENKDCCETSEKSLYCDGNDDVCKECGGNGQPCCPCPGICFGGGTCDNGFFCIDNTICTSTPPGNTM